ncbi:MAG: imidazole glycerol phosphate synthase subunit HisH [Firmicutes bacterium]|nr:imidazole glycerol phosphate synthase subunit HisH [Bacillota bacterium]
MIAIVDYGVGNLLSVQKALAKLDEASILVTNGDALADERVRGVIVPGVGAFGDAMVALRRQGLLKPLRTYARAGRPLLGICLGMQLLFSVSEEHGEHVGLGFVPGHVRRMRGEYKIPHVGWNQLDFDHGHPLLQGVTSGAYVYFVHSYYVEPVDPSDVLATTSYHVPFASMIAQGNIMGMQFHPEKSGETGLALLKNFASMCSAREVGT